MRTVWKFTIRPYDGPVKEFDVPEGARLLHVGAERPGDEFTSHTTVGFWFEVETGNEPEARVFELDGTGHPLSSGTEYVGTVIAPPLVLHAYERTGLRR